jgi:hypothetical protein
MLCEDCGSQGPRPSKLGRALATTPMAAAGGAGGAEDPHPVPALDEVAYVCLPLLELDPPYGRLP